MVNDGANVNNKDAPQLCAIDDIPELHYRLIAATARYLDAPIITNDPVIRKSKFVKIIT